jgi:Domain of unknown function (DUF4389)
VHAQRPIPGGAVLEVAFQSRRHRWAVLQPLLGYPQLIVLVVLGFPLIFSGVWAWFSLVIAGHLPEHHRRWMSLWLAAAVRVWAYMNLIDGTYPGWRLSDDDQPVQLFVGPRKPRYSRSKALLRIIYIVPAYIAAVLGALVNYALLVISAISILLTGRQSESIFRIQRAGLAWYAHYGLLINLVIEDYDFELQGSRPQA